MSRKLTTTQNKHKTMRIQLKLYGVDGRKLGQADAPLEPSLSLAQAEEILRALAAAAQAARALPPAEVTDAL